MIRYSKLRAFHITVIHSRFATRLKNSLSKFYNINLQGNGFFELRDIYGWNLFINDSCKSSVHRKFLDSKLNTYNNRDLYAYWVYIKIVLTIFDDANILFSFLPWYTYGVTIFYFAPQPFVHVYCTVEKRKQIIWSVRHFSPIGGWSLDWEIII